MTTRRRKKHRPEEIVAKLRDVAALLNDRKPLADQAGQTVLPLGGITSPARFYMRQGTRN